METEDRAWLDKVLNFTTNDRPYIRNFYYDDRDNPKLFTSQYLQPQYQVIRSVSNPTVQYTDPDNPAIEAIVELEWQQDTTTNLWQPSTNERVRVISNSIQAEDPLNFISLLYTTSTITETQDMALVDSTIRSCQSTNTSKVISKQSDSGANTSATNNIHLLKNVKYIQPVEIKSATAEAQPMRMLAVGTITLYTSDGAKLEPTCFYSPDIDGTIISPDAIAREFANKFKGFTKICDCSSNKGSLIFEPIEDSYSPTILPLVSKNNLWYHEDSNRSMNNKDSSPQPVINSLSNAAAFELWHQRLCHPGTNVMNSIHKHAKNVPQLKGNSFWKCNSCLSGKFDKCYHVKAREAKTTTKVQPEISEDDIYMPNAKPGQHFHLDFGFVKSKHFQEKDDAGRTQTSIDGKNSYLLIIDRATRYTWVYVSSSKLPPIDFCQKVLNKFKSKCEHKTIRCDQGELANSQDFNKMIDDEGFSLEVTGTDNSKQNGMAERPHRTYGNMMRCVLHSAGLLSNVGNRLERYLSTAVFSEAVAPNAIIFHWCCALSF